MKKIILFTISVITIGCIASGCSKTSDTTPTNGGGGGITFSCIGITPRFSVEVTSIFTSVCSVNSNCHGAGSTNSGGPFTNFTEIFAKRSNIRAQVLSGAMPQTGSLTQAQINNLICWIDSGAPNN